MADENTFYADDDINRIGLRMARNRGVTIVTSDEAGLSGADDDIHFSYAIEHGYVLVTANIQDFRPMVDEWLEQHDDFPGIVYVNGLANQRPKAIADGLVRLQLADLRIQAGFIS